MHSLLILLTHLGHSNMVRGINGPPGHLANLGATKGAYNVYLNLNEAYSSFITPGNSEDLYYHLASSFSLYENMNHGFLYESNK